MGTGEAVTVFEVDAEHTRRLAAAFRSWAGSDDDLRVLFTPDVLIGIEVPQRRGYLYDDGWTIEAWIARGVQGFRDELLAVMEGDAFSTTLDERPGRAGLMDLVIERGSPFLEVRHLL